MALAGTQAMVRHIAKTVPHAELMDTWVWFQSGINTDGAHNPVTNRQVRAGDILSLNCFPMIFGYYTALERTLFCEYASDAHLDYWKKNCEVMRIGCDLIQPGKKCSEIAAELILGSGTDSQKKQWLPKIASGELRLQSMGVTEPTTGSDTTKLKTTAVKKDGRWVVNGSDQGIVRIDIDPATTVRTMVFPINPHELYISLVNPTGFLEAIGRKP